jgi:invasion protein IalB
MDRTRRLALILPLAATACAQMPAETPEEATQRWAVTCLEAGFARDSDAYKVCLLLEQQNDRMAYIERRLQIIESQTVYTPPLFPRRWYW